MSAVPIKLFQFLNTAPPAAVSLKAMTREEIAQTREVERQIARARAKLFAELKQEAKFYWVKIRDALEASCPL